MLLSNVIFGTIFSKASNYLYKSDLIHSHDLEKHYDNHFKHEEEVNNNFEIGR